MFEITGSDLSGRLGRIETNHGTVHTPAFVPVIHPSKQSIPAEKIRGIGFELVITNAYIARKNYGQEAVERGIHGIIGHDGPVMTDSGGYQVLEYGDVDVTPEQMRLFETGIMTDFAIPLDRPTGFGMPKAAAKRYVDHTLAVCEETIRAAPDNGQVWVGPIQGGEHQDLVARSARGLVRSGFPMMALGSPVEFMESYEYALLARMIAQAKRHIPESVPLHLFGAGHPLTIPLAVALGCDTFDSASYMLYARQDRYITEDGTRRLPDMSYFACACPVCAGTTPKGLMELGAAERATSLAVHNLHAIRSEVDRTREAISEGRLWEYAVRKCRAHPRLYEALGVLTGQGEHMARTTPAFKHRALFLYGPEDQHRPEAVAYARRAAAFRSKKPGLLIMPDTHLKPAYLAPEYSRYRNLEDTQICQYSPFLGVIPLEISDMYPAAHRVESRGAHDPQDFGLFGQRWQEFFSSNRFEKITYDRSDVFLSHFVKQIPYPIRRASLGRKEKKKGAAERG